eukprot:gene7301-14890_t
MSRGGGWKDMVKRDDRFLDMVDILEGKSANPILKVCDPQSDDVFYRVATRVYIVDKKKKCVESKQREHYTTREARCVKAVLSRSVVTGTKKRIKAGIKRWLEFLNDHVGERKYPYMRGLSDKAKCYRILMLVDTLYESGLRGTSISIFVSQVHSAFSLEGREGSVFESELIKRGREGGRLTTEEVRVAVEKTATMEKYPFTMDMALQSRVMYRSVSTWNGKGMDRRAIWLGIALCFDSGMLVSNLTEAEKDHEDHGIKANQTWFEVRRGGEGRSH